MLNEEERELLEEFLWDIYDDLTDNNYLYIAKINEEKYIQKYYKTSKLCPKRNGTKTLLQMFEELIESKENVFFTPNTFSKTKDSGRTQSFCNSSRVLYFDIDNVDGIDNIKTKDDVLKFLSKYAFLTNKYYPKYALISGHGIHLYFIIESVDMHSKYENEFKVTDSGIYKYILRIPFSYNAKDKDNIIQTKFFKLKEDEELYKTEYYFNYSALYRQPIVTNTFPSLTYLEDIYKHMYTYYSVKTKENNEENKEKEKKET